MTSKIYLNSSNKSYHFICLIHLIDDNAEFSLNIFYLSSLKKKKKHSKSVYHRMGSVRIETRMKKKGGGEERRVVERERESKEVSIASLASNGSFSCARWILSETLQFRGKRFGELLDE